MRDTQKTKLYRAEHALDTIKKPVGDGSVAAMQRRATEIMDSDTVTKLIGTSYQRHLYVSDGRGRRSACASGMGEISMPRFARNDAYLLHELAHIIRCAHRYYQKWQMGNWLPEEADHGWEFADTLLKLVSRFMGVEAAKALKASFKQHRVRYSPRRKARALTEVEREALRTRLQAARARRYQSIPVAV